MSAVGFPGSFHEIGNPAPEPEAPVAPPVPPEPEETADASTQPAEETADVTGAPDPSTLPGPDAPEATPEDVAAKEQAESLESAAEVADVSAPAPASSEPVSEESVPAEG